MAAAVDGEALPSSVFQVVGITEKTGPGDWEDSSWDLARHPWDSQKRMEGIAKAWECV